MESDFRKSFFFDDNFFSKKKSISKIFEKTWKNLKNPEIFEEFPKISKIFGIEENSKKKIVIEKKTFSKIRLHNFFISS